jgi:hypothetical protein
MRSIKALFHHLAGARKQRGWDRQTERAFAVLR